MHWIEGLDLWKFFAGIGLFLFGMIQIEEALKALAGRTFKKIIRSFTTHPILGILNGVVSTAILQSSSIVTLMVLSFVGADILSLRNALGIVLGANLGTTVKGWVVATVGFSVHFDGVILPMLAIGCCGLIFLGPRFRAYHFLIFIIGLGLLFMGLEYMNESMAGLAQNVDLSALKGFGLPIYFLFGFVFTAIIQSSSVAMMMTLSALNVGLVQLPEAAALVIGADLGTTMTATIGAIGGSAIKKRVAAAHFIFNLITDILALSLLGIILAWISEGMEIRDPLFALVAFHSSFNLIGIFLFFPFLGYFEKFLNRLWADRRESVSEYVWRVEPEQTDAALEAINKDLHLLFRRVFHYIQSSLGARAADDNTSENFVIHFLFLPPQQSFAEYENIKKTEGEILKFITRVQAKQLEEGESKSLQKDIFSLRLAVQAAKAAKDIEHNILEFKRSANEDIELFEKVLGNEYGYIQGQFVQIFSRPLSNLTVEQVDALVPLIDKSLDRVNTWIYGELQHDPGLAQEVATLLNVNREIYNSQSALAKALLEHLKNGD